MKLYHLDRTDLRQNSISVSHNKFPHFLKLWHYHEQLELVHILKSSGTRFVGNGIEKFSSGEVILLGKNIPHMWMNDQPYFENKGLEAEAIAIHFKEDFLGKGLLETAEFQHFNVLFDQAKMGLRFIDVSSGLIEKIKSMLTLSAFERILAMLEILNALFQLEVKMLSSTGYEESFDSDNGHMDEVYSFIYKNFKSQISLADAANVLDMHPAAFSRLFKKVSRKTFSRYLNEIKVGYACKLILEQKFSMSEVCFESGFNNISNFNRQFRLITSSSPSEFLEKHLKRMNSSHV